MSVTLYVENCDSFINFANENFYEIFNSFSNFKVGEELTGEITEEQAVSILAEITLRRSNKDFSDLIKETIKENNFTSIGRDAEYVNRRLDEIAYIMALGITSSSKIAYG